MKWLGMIKIYARGLDGDCISLEIWYDIMDYINVRPKADV